MPNCCLGYENLVDRTEVRENAWSRPGWDQCVSRTGENAALARHSRHEVTKIHIQHLVAYQEVHGIH